MNLQSFGRFDCVISSTSKPFSELYRKEICLFLFVIWAPYSQQSFIFRTPAHPPNMK